MRAGLKSNLNICARCLPGRPQSEKHGGDRRDGKSEAEDGQIKGDVLKSRHALWRQANQCITDPSGDEKAKHTAKQGDQKTFHQKLANDLATCRANCRANSELARSRGTASGEKICHVGASNKQNQSDRAEEQGQISPIFADQTFEQ